MTQENTHGGNNYPAVATLSAEVTEVLEDQDKRGQVLKLSEQEARSQFPNLVVASLGANRKEKPGGTITARVLHDGTNGISVNRRTRVRDQERFPTAADVKRIMREKAAIGEQSFALTADVKEATSPGPGRSKGTGTCLAARYHLALVVDICK